MSYTPAAPQFTVPSDASRLPVTLPMLAEKQAAR